MFGVAQRPLFKACLERLPLAWRQIEQEPPERLPQLAQLGLVLDVEIVRHIVEIILDNFGPVLLPPPTGASKFVRHVIRERGPTRSEVVADRVAFIHIRKREGNGLHSGPQEFLADRGTVCFGAPLKLRPNQRPAGGVHWVPERLLG